MFDPESWAANRNNRSINYVKILPAVRRTTRISLSIRTLRQYGQELGAKFKRARGRTNTECQRVNMQHSTNDCISVDCQHIECRSLLVVPVDSIRSTLRRSGRTEKEDSMNCKAGIFSAPVQPESI